MQGPARRAQRAEDLVERFDLAPDRPVVPDLPKPAAPGEGDRDRFYVDIEPDERATVRRDLPPGLWRCAKAEPFA
jgi:hypothetical protein